MDCSSPVEFRTGYAPCFRCENCRKARRRVTISRLLIEGLAHRQVCMVTLTYSPANLPAGGSLVPADTQAFLWRWRSAYRRVGMPSPRFFLVGEYGGRFGRPHYHLIVFGADKSTDVNGLPLSNFVHRTWGKGSVHVGGGWSSETAAYVSGYVAKGHNVRGLDLLGGRHPEFSRWPNGPGGGLGVPGLPFLLEILLAGETAGDFLDRECDLPPTFRDGDRDRVVGGFLLDKARKRLGFSDFEIRELKRRALSVEGRVARAASAAELLPVDCFDQYF